MANFQVAAAIPPTFPDDFTVKPLDGYIPTAVEQSYLDALNAVRADIASDAGNDAKIPDATKSALIQARVLARHDVLEELKDEAEKFVQGQMGGATAAANAPVIKGKYRRDTERLGAQLFVVGVRCDGNLANELLIHVSPGTAGSGPTPDQQALYVALNSAETVIKSACARVGKKRKISVAQDADHLLDEYIRKLAGIGSLGLEAPHVQLAKLALDGLRAEFVAREAGRIKNAYMRRLGGVATAAAALFLLMYIVIEWGFVTSTWWGSHKTFLLAGSGAAIGCWMSFAIRRVTLTFDDLAILEEDLLDPSLRVLFVIGLTITACLLFWNGAMNIEIGSLKTAGLLGSKAMLVGIFCGIAERTLATAISGRATAFVKTIGATN